MFFSAKAADAGLAPAFLEYMVSDLQLRLKRRAREAALTSRSLAVGERRDYIFNYIVNHPDQDLLDEARKMWPEQPQPLTDMAFGVLHAAYMTGALLSPFADKFDFFNSDISEYLLLICGVVLDPWRFGGQIVSIGQPKSMSEAIEALGGRERVVRSVNALTNDRFRHLCRFNFPALSSRSVFMPFLVASALEAAAVLFDDGVMMPDEYAKIEKLRSERGWALTRFLAFSGLVSSGAEAAENEAMRLLFAVLGIQIAEEEFDYVRPDPTARDLLLLFPCLCERQALLECLCLVMALGGQFNERGSDLCLTMAYQMQIPEVAAREIVEYYRMAAAQKQMCLVDALPPVQRDAPHEFAERVAARLQR